MIKKYKYTRMIKAEMIVSWIVMIMIFLIIDLNIFSSKNIIVIIITALITLYFISLNINNYIKVEIYGVKEYRKFNSTEIKWQNIRRIEYVKRRGGKNSCAMNIYGPIDMTNNIYIENDFENYLDIWKCVIDECNKRDIKPIIDEKILRKLEEYSN